MEARVFAIEERLKSVVPGPVGAANFKLGDERAFNAERLLSDPNFSLYCLDFENHHAYFTETPPDCDLSRVPFMYQAQYQLSTHLVRISFDTLHRLSSEVHYAQSKLLLIYSVGRCGSTLVSRALNEVEGIDSLSEPDTFTQLLPNRGSEALSYDERAALLRSCTALQCAPGLARGKDVFALKFRSDVTHLAPLFYSLLPQAKLVFLYRNAEPWARSNWRYVQVAFPGVAGTSVDSPRPDWNGRTMLESLAMRWLGPMQTIQEMLQQGIPLFIARYEELTSHPHEVLGKMFAHCGLGSRTVGSLDTVLTQDAQEGTVLSRASLATAPTQLTAENLAALRKKIEELAPGMSADYILPGTYLP